jgi:hypothetical protein
MTAFARYIGIDYSGAETPSSSLKGLRIYAAEGAAEALEVLPPPSPRKYWTRRGLAEWLAGELQDGPPTIVGIDHAFSFPLRYFEVHGLQMEWPRFLEDFQQHWPSDLHHLRDLRDGHVGDASARAGDTSWRRVTELRAPGAKSVFHFDVNGTVAHSTHAGIPWLRFLRRRLGSAVHFWPFDGWMPAPGQSTVVEVYPSLWRHAYPVNGRTGDQHDAYTVASWLQQAERDGRLAAALQPALSSDERMLAQVEGWILGVG